MRINSATALGFVLALNGALAAPILQNRAIEVKTVYATTTQIVSATTTVYISETSTIPTPTPTPHKEEEEEEEDDDDHETTHSSYPALVAVTSTTSTSTSTSSSPSPESTTSAPSTSVKSEPKTSTSTETPLTTSLAPISIPSKIVEVSTSSPEPTSTYSPVSVTSVIQPPTTVPTTTSTQAVVPTPASNKGTSSTDFRAGKVTFYDAGVGSCGKVNFDTDLIVAAPKGFMALALDEISPNTEPNTNKNPHCLQQVNFVGPNGQTVTITITDTCPSCSMEHWDMSRASYKALGCEEAAGVCAMKFQTTQNFTPAFSYPSA